jgi:signal transduction histidine kinase/ligand-binding sensor domain-containing protein/CheY-like chemotaxis protein/AraC-like DNA-binding protein
MANIFKYCFFIIFAAFVAKTSAASNNSEIRLFNNIKVSDGLPVNEIFSITQDSAGFMWLATINGFVRYDGYEMKLFKHDATNRIKLPDNQVTDIVKDGDGGLWVGCYDGLIHIDTRTFKNEEINLGSHREVRCLLNQNDSVLWIGTADGLIKMNKNNHTYTIINNHNSPFKSSIIRSLYVDNDGVIWAGTFDGLYSVSEDKIEGFDLKKDYKPELNNNLILEIEPFTPDNDSLLWIGTETGLILFNRYSKETQTFNSQNTGFGNEVIKCIFPVEEGEIYFGTDFGFYHFDLTTKHFDVSTHDPFNNYSLANNVVWDIFQDNAGIIWLATANGISKLNTDRGMFQFTPVYYKEANITTGNQINDIYADKDETLWLATKKGVIAIFQNGKKEKFTSDSNSPHKLVLNNINTISGDKLGRIWIGSAGGINIWDPAKREMYTITANFETNQGLLSNYISTFLSPPDGSFWIVTWGGGMYKVRGNFSKINEIYFDYVANFNTNIIAADKKIWIKHEKQIYNIDLSTLQTEQPSQLNKAIGENEINSLLVDSKGTIWIGLNDQILFYNQFKQETRPIDVVTGKESFVNNLIEDNNGNIWGTTLTSIFKYSPQKDKVESFPMQTGIPLDIFLPQSNAKTKSGQILFGGNDGYISFYPNRVKKNKFSPNVVISGFKVNNEEVDISKQLKGSGKLDRLVTFSEKVTLKHEQNSVSITFASLHYGNPKRNLYAYKLEGYDKEWNYTTGDKNMASYSYLSPNTYNFIVKGTNNDGVWSPNIATLQLTVKPPLWASAWAIVIYILVLQMIILALFITFRNKIRWKDEIRRITLEKKKNEEIALEKQQFFTNISHEFRTPLGLITGPVETLLNRNNNDEYQQQSLSLIHKSSRRLLTLVNQLLDLRKIENNTLQVENEESDIIEIIKKQYDLFTEHAFNQQLSFHFKSNINQLIAPVDSIKLESIIQNLLSNAFKNTPKNGEVTLKVKYLINQNLLIKVKDTGIGIDKENQQNIFNRFFQVKNNKNTGYGIGLNIAKEYCELMNGKIWFESQPGKGSSFFVQIPIGEISKISQEKIEKIGAKESSEQKNQNELKLNTNNLPVLLIVDDHPDTLDFLKINLNSSFAILTAQNGKEAFGLLSKNKVNLIISDIMMPGMDGIEFCEKVNHHPKYSHIPFILLTAKIMDEQQADAYKAGANAFLSKPFNINVLKAQIENLLHKNQMIDDYIKQNLIIENQKVVVESSDERMLQQTIRYINDHLSDTDINLDKMSKAIGVSHSSLYRKVKAQTGMSLNELVRNVKLKRAAQLIKTDKMTIAEIMDETGFTSHSYFSKCFKKQFKVTPRQYNSQN